MSSTKYILGVFDDPDEMMHGIDKLQKNSVPIYDVYTPMPIHGIEAKLNIKDSRLGYAAFMFGCLGGTIMFSMVYYMLVHDWPINIGGKNFFAIPDFIPVTFEWTVLWTSFGMTFTFFFASHLFPGRAPRVMDLRATDDKFVIAINAKGNISHDDITNLLKEAGATEVKHNDRKYVSYE
ncbi:MULTISPECIES: DUF3341 domain-containing protein [Mucilaginibacter]|jgi:hypothetical protein|uniref:DUF3341 domain-containing protein n=4 Tax=Mucilaginibacter TaxID=423349 RepID=A0AAE6JLW6_9SPHI|nr:MULTISPECIES: DUF3341 domain-containing protein [Mucilaginibacter]QEM07753.1 DUF3341 domain-containing protein [Mucilaginibacter rubeus]QEM20205.1 DUF3341 domain-containing protein [Mucilaginibacter gossypii]QTE34780.1 DUF3341 domain-containing protein [Mucilaginibacter gossypii]QTE43079.1 DUF3341 domain-containing protein [Mucilaginibacter rubeus]QTE49680.1 DUF3341 domain-containing protein [Mucilaginibacter rubeus]